MGERITRKQLNDLLDAVFYLGHSIYQTDPESRSPREQALLDEIIRMGKPLADRSFACMCEIKPEDTTLVCPIEHRFDRD